MIGGHKLPKGTSTVGRVSVSKPFSVYVSSPRPQTFPFDSRRTLTNMKVICYLLGLVESNQSPTPYPVDIGDVETHSLLFFPIYVSTIVTSNLV